MIKITIISAILAPVCFAQFPSPKKPPFVPPPLEKDKKPMKQEFGNSAAAIKEMIAALDADKDGALSKAELDKGFSKFLKKKGEKWLKLHFLKNHVIDFGDAEKVKKPAEKKAEK